MTLHCIATGSTGNAYVVDAGEDQILLDCGVPWRRVQQGLGFDLSRLRAVFVSHEHKDHCTGVQGAVEAGIPCYMSEGTRHAIGISGHRVITLEMYSLLIMDNFTVMQFPTEHDAIEPAGWIIRYKPTGEQLLYATDTYYLRIQPAGVHYFLLECNYIKDVLEQNIADGKVPEAMKRRLLNSHFGMHNVIDFLSKADTASARKVVIVHLSDNNSNEQRMCDEIEAAVGIPTAAARAGESIDLSLYPF